MYKVFSCHLSDEPWHRHVAQGYDIGQARGAIYPGLGYDRSVAIERVYAHYFVISHVEKALWESHFSGSLAVCGVVAASV